MYDRSALLNLIGSPRQQAFIIRSPLKSRHLIRKLASTALIAPGLMHVLQKFIRAECRERYGMSSKVNAGGR